MYTYVYYAGDNFFVYICMLTNVIIKKKKARIRSTHTVRTKEKANGETVQKKNFLRWKQMRTKLHNKQVF